MMVEDMHCFDEEDFQCRAAWSRQLAIWRTGQLVIE